MTFKKLTEKDFTTGYGSIIGNEYNTLGWSAGTASSERQKKQIANIVNGGEVNINWSSISAYIILNRSRFKERIHIPSLRVDGNPIPYGPENVFASGAGEAYKLGSIYVFPEVGIILGATSITVNSERINTTSHVYIKASRNEFNYSTNPSFSDIQGNIRFPELRDNPVTYITTIGLYNDNGDLLAVAKVPPTKKTFHDEVLFELQLDF